jgi:hypothetical protein
MKITVALALFVVSVLGLSSQDPDSLEDYTW